MKNSTDSWWKRASRVLASARRSPKRVCVSCFISALRPITSFVRWHLHVNGKSERAGIRWPRAGINQKGNLKKGLQPARCITTPKGCRTANSQECRYFEEIVSLTKTVAFFFSRIALLYPQISYKRNTISNYFFHLVNLNSCTPENPLLIF